VRNVLTTYPNVKFVKLVRPMHGGFATISLVRARSAFAAGGVYEDPATAAAAGVLKGYLRDVEWLHGGAVEIIQGQDIGMPSRIRADV